MIFKSTDTGDTFGSLDPRLKITLSLVNWRNSGGGQKSPSITQLEFQPGTPLRRKRRKVLVIKIQSF